MLWRKRDLINPPKEILPPGAGVVPAPGLPQGQVQGQGTIDTYDRPSEPDPRLRDRRIAQTAFLWRVRKKKHRGLAVFIVLLLVCRAVTCLCLAG